MKTEPASRARRRLTCFDQVGDENLKLIARALGLSYSEACRLGIAKLAEKLAEQAPMTAAALALGGRLSYVSDREAGKEKG